MAASNQNAGGGAVLLAFVAGAIAGAAVALLFAPATGEETRDFINQRAHRMFADLARRAEQVMSAVPSLLGPAGKGFAFLNGIKAALAAIQELRRSSRRGAAHPEEEDALFIG